MAEAFPETRDRGMAHVLAKKIAADSLMEWYSSSKDPAVRSMACLWNGDDWMWPRQTPFVMLTTHVSFFHRVRSAVSWADVAWFILDEFHNVEVLSLLFLALFVYLKKKGDPRVADARLLLMTATQTGPILRASLRFLEDQGISTSTVHVHPVAELPQRVHLWSVVTKPKEWVGMKSFERAARIAELMGNWVEREWCESAVILFIVAGEAELHRMAAALKFSRGLINTKWHWEIATLSSDTTSSQKKVVFDRLAEQDCRQGWPAYFVIVKAGIAEDSWTPNVNCLVDLGEEIVKDAHGFLHVAKASDAAKEQRKGRVARHRRGLHVNVLDDESCASAPVSPDVSSDQWEMPYSDRLLVSLAAADVHYDGVIPVLDPVLRTSAEEDWFELGCYDGSKSPLCHVGY